MDEILHEWAAHYTCRQPGINTSEEQHYFLHTDQLSKAAILIEQDIGDNLLVQLRKVP